MTLRFLAGLLFLALFFSGTNQAQREPAGEGRPITPAGTLVMDAATRLAAVGAMPMNTLRSPDAKVIPFLSLTCVWLIPSS